MEKQLIFWAASLGIPAVILFIFKETGLINTESTSALLFGGVILWIGMMMFVGIIENSKE